MTFTYQLIRKQAVPAAALRSYWLSWDHGCACSALFLRPNLLFNLTLSVWLGHMHAHKTQYKQVTRLFAALSVGILELANFYGQLKFGEAPKALFFPCSTDAGHSFAADGLAPRFSLAIDPRSAIS